MQQPSNKPQKGSDAIQHPEGAGGTDTAHALRKAVGIRGRVTHFSSKSKRRFVTKAQQHPGLNWRATLTYGLYAPTDPDAVEPERKRLSRILRQAGISGFWKLEFQARGALHFELLLAAPEMTEAELLAILQRFVRGVRDWNPGNVKVTSIYDLDGAIRYLAKSPGMIPTQWAGRFWGEFGPPAHTPKRANTRLFRCG